MSVILVVEQDARFAQRIREALRPDGLAVETADSGEEAMNLARSHAPRLLLASSTLARAPELLAAFSRSRGGPGSVVLIPGTADPGSSAAELAADELLVEPFSDDDLRQLVRRCLKSAPSRQPIAPRPTASSEQLTSDDIFGDVLAEVEAEAQRTDSKPRVRKPAIPMDDIERKLEETLSGVIPIAGRKKRPSVTRAPASRGTQRKRPELPDDSEIDALLDQTLSSLDIPTRARKPASGRRQDALPRAELEPLPTPEAPSPPFIPSPSPSEVPKGVTEPVDASEGSERPTSRLDGEAAPPSPGPDPRPGPVADLEELWSPADQFRTQALPTLDGGREPAAASPVTEATRETPRVREAPPAPDSLPDREEAPAQEASPILEVPPTEEPDGEVGARTRAGKTESAGGGRLKWLAAVIIVGALVALGLLFLRSQRETGAPAPVSSAPAPPVEAPAPESPGGGSPTDETDTALAAETTDEGGLAPAAGIDIEQMVNQELSNRAELLRRDFEAEKKRIEEELAKTQSAGAPPPSDEEVVDEDKESGGGS